MSAKSLLVPSLIQRTAEVWTVDAHQHLPPETTVETDLCRLIADDNYVCTDLTSAGMTDDMRRRIADPVIPLLQRWKTLSGFWKCIRHGSYAQAIETTLRELYDARFDDLDTITDVSERIAGDFAAPDLYRRLLYDRCHIDAVLTQSQVYFKHERPAFFNVSRICLDTGDFSEGGAFDRTAAQAGMTIRSADDLSPAMDALIRREHALGAVGLKVVTIPWHAPTDSEIKQAFAACRPGPPKNLPSWKRWDAALPLACLFLSRVAVLAEELNVPVAVHTGAPWTNWLDFRLWEPTQLIPFLYTYRNTRFDLYHAGIPYMTQAAMLGKTCPNVWHNLCWAHLISSELSIRIISELLDMVPMNKIIAFGGDYNNRTVVLTYGHLAVARRNVAEALSRRVLQGRMTKADALSLIEPWFSENPRTLYGLPKPHEPAC